MLQYCKLSKPKDSCIKGRVYLNGSKSISNRLLIIDALCDAKLEISNLSVADDTTTLQRLLHSNASVLDAGAGGTTFRFLTAYLSIQEGREVILTGSERMQERPIKVLFDALLSLGADISYLGKDGFPPLRIRGEKLKGGKISVEANISSQYISALLLIAPTLENGLELNLKGKRVSESYIEMTLELLRYFGIQTSFSDNTISVKPGKYITRGITVEADWSAAAYYYAIAILSDASEIELMGLSARQLQGDSVIADIAMHFGVETIWKDQSVLLKKINSEYPKSFSFDFIDCPDLAQTVIVFCAALGVELFCKGLQTLRNKETDRIQALDQELMNLGLARLIEIEHGYWKLDILTSKMKANKEWISTYDDHRMAMAFAPLSLLNEIKIAHPHVVEKSYPGFWEDLKRLGFMVESE